MTSQPLHSDVRNSVLLNTFTINNKKERYKVFYNNGFLIWEKEKSKKEKHSIPVEDIISIEKEKPKNLSPSRSNQTLPTLDASNPSINSVYNNNCEDYTTITINYAKRLIDPNSGHENNSSNSNGNVNKWRIHSITLFNNDKLIVREWYETLTKILDALQRPKNILLFVNPYGGRQNALELYEKYAKPIFRLANIDVSVIITQRPNQIFDLVLQQHLDLFDGIITCGGDGTFSELFNGLIYKEMLKINPNDPLRADIENIPNPNKPLGIIPAGSTDTIAYSLHGSSDVKTCVIQIVLGSTTGMDISSVSNDKGIIKFYASAMSYGFLGDILFDSESHRWLGPKRYEYSGFKKFLANRAYDVELEILQEPATAVENNSGTNVESDVIINCDETLLKCYENCSKCSINEKDESKLMTDNEEKYRKISGKVFMIMGANISCACTRSPSGVSPYNHIGDGYVDLIVIRHGNWWNVLNFLLMSARDDGDISKLPFVESYRTRKFHMKALNSSSLRSLSDSIQPISSVISNKHSSVWNCDGEILQESEVTVRCHRQLIRVFRRGAASMSSDVSSNCCFT